MKKTVDKSYSEIVEDNKKQMKKDGFSVEDIERMKRKQSFGKIHYSHNPPRRKN